MPHWRSFVGVIAFHWSRTLVSFTLQYYSESTCYRRTSAASFQTIWNPLAVKILAAEGAARNAATWLRASVHGLALRLASSWRVF